MSHRTSRSKGSPPGTAVHAGPRAVVAAYNAHFGEEAPLVGRRGSGTIFFSGCNLLCSFCQNYEISQLRSGQFATPETLAANSRRITRPFLRISTWRIRAGSAALDRTSSQKGAPPAWGAGELPCSAR